MIETSTSALAEIQQHALSKLPIEIAQALLRLRDRVVARFPNEIAHFILYGSFARGEAHAESDVDVMIVTTWPVKRLPGGWYESGATDPRQEEIVDMATDAMLECGRFVSAYVLNATFFERVSDVAIEARREGIELLSTEIIGTALRINSPVQMIRERVEEYAAAEFPDLGAPLFWLSLADEELNAARVLFKSAFFDNVISRAYYAMLYASKAALLSIGIKVKSHAGAVSEFGKQFVVTGRIDRSYSTMFAQASRQRIRSDYEPIPRATHEKAIEAITNAEVFIAKARELVDAEISKK